MKAVEIIAAGCMRKTLYEPLLLDYQKRTKWPVAFYEIDSKHKSPAQINTDENGKFLKKLNPDAYIIALDETGKALTSRAFSQIFSRLQNEGRPYIQFIIGGADGLSAEVKQRADFLLSFGRQTWPHMLARVMLTEQIYRADQILSGHPYHRD